MLRSCESGAKNTYDYACTKCTFIQKGEGLTLLKWKYVTNRPKETLSEQNDAKQVYLRLENIIPTQCDIYKGVGKISLVVSFLPGTHLRKCKTDRDKRDNFLAGFIIYWRSGQYPPNYYKLRLNIKYWLKSSLSYMVSKFKKKTWHPSYGTQGKLKKVPTFKISILKFFFILRRYST
jgi:hypothetical protein